MPGTSHERRALGGDTGTLGGDAPADDNRTVRQGAEDGDTSSGLRLVVLGTEQPAVHALPDFGEVTIGRSSSATVRVEDPLVSRTHVVLRLGATSEPTGDPNVVGEVIDAGSANGVRLRGRKLASRERVPFEVGDSIQIGDTTLLVQRGAAPTAVRVEGFALPAARKSAPAPEPPAALDAMARLRELVARVANSTISVLILGETGVGKEVLAERIHRESPRSGAPFVRLSCAALSESLLESELFGHEKGAFTGALAAKQGLIETAQGGTLFLDEVGELPLSMQVKLLRVLEDRKVTRVGGLVARPIDMRILAATNRDLELEITRGTFRQDLFFRLNGITFVIPPLRERAAEILPLAVDFAREAAGRSGRTLAPTFAREATDALLTHAWPGNVRELRNVIERAVLLAGDGMVRLEHLAFAHARPKPPPAPPSYATAAYPTAPSAYAPAPSAYAPPPSHASAPLPSFPLGPSPAPLPSFPLPPPSAPFAGGVDAFGGRLSVEERDRIVDALNRCAGNQTKAAELLGISRRTLVARLDAYGFPRPRKP